MKAPSKPSAGSLAVLVGKPAGGKSPVSAEEPGDLELAAQDLISALKKGNAKAVAAAFESMSSLCKYAEEEEDEE